MYFLFLILKIYLSPSTSPVNSILPVAAQMHDKINVFGEVFFPPCNCYYHSWNSLFSISIVTIVQKTNPFNTSGSLWIQTILGKAESNKERFWSGLTQRVWSDPDHSNRIRKKKKLLFCIFTNIYHIAEWIWFV